MLKYDLDILKKCANNLMFDMSNDEYHILLNEFKIITEQMELLGEIDGLNDVTPMVFPFDVTTSYLRDDVADDCLSKEEVLKNAKDTLDGQIKLPKVVG